jgi:uncharacterized membrane protein YoaT (DUF817 family)
VIYLPCVVWFRPDRAHRPMPLFIGLILVALFIWFAENLGTFAQAWTYPDQDGPGGRSPSPSWAAGIY